jgi:hypothetical protein
LVALLFAVSCGGTGGTIQPSPSPASTSVSEWASVEVVVDTSKNPTCVAEVAAKPGACFLLLYMEPPVGRPSATLNSVGGSKCDPKKDTSKCWPQRDTELTALCREDGPLVQDVEGMTSSVWYGVVMPSKELLVDRSLVASTSADELVGFASSLWLRRLTQREPPPCKGMIAFG